MDEQFVRKTYNALTREEINMKKVLVVVAVLCAFAIGQNRQRMVFLGSEEINDKNGHVTFDYFHDNQTKQEVVCVFGGLNATACYLTGRTW